MCKVRALSSGEWISTALLASALLSMALISTAREASAEEGSDVTWKVGPYVNARATDTGETIDVGVEALPSSVSAIGGIAALTVRKGATDDTFAEVSSERFNFGVAVQLFTEFGRGAQTRNTIESRSDTSLFGVVVDGSWAFAKYDFRPRGGAVQSTVACSWFVQLGGWWFTTIGARGAGPASEAAESVSGSRTPPAPADRSAWLMQPQLEVRYGRLAVEAPDSYVVGEPDDAGLQLAERMKLAPPTTVPIASVLLAVPFEPPSSRFAFGPALRFTTRGAGDEWEPLSSVGRARLELWLYYFAFDRGPAVRVGAAPYMSVRAYGTEARDDVAAGGIIELREATSRLAY